jgi:hypothetical protein
LIAGRSKFAGRSLAGACEGKPKYETHSEAQTKLDYCTRKRDPVRIYRCEFCHKWHIGSKNRLEKKFTKTYADC